jgi:hypothetical protein
MVVIIKFWELTLVMILFNLFGSALVNSGLFTSMGISENIYVSSPTQTDIEDMEEKLKTSVSDQVSSNDPATTLFGVISDATSKVISSFFNPLKRYIFWPNMIMQLFGIPNEIGYAFTIVFNTIQLIGILQFITGKGFREME